MNTEQRAKFIKLIEFLEALEPHKFYFGELVTGFNKEQECGTICCAVGWMPKVFPESVAWEKCDRGYGIEWTVVFNKEDSYWYDAVERFFGLPADHAALFSPSERSYVSPELANLRSDAEPRQVAAMLRDYLKMLDKGEV